MNRPDSLDAERLKHLIKFAETRGRFWRRKLRDYWHNGITHGFLSMEEASTLQYIRNNLAPLINRVSLALMQEWEEDDRYRAEAKRLHHDEGECEIDSGAEVSRGDDAGAYVQAWVWVPHPERGTPCPAPHKG